MGSKTGKLMLSGAVTVALAAGCQTQPLSTTPSMGLDRAGLDGYGVLGKGRKGAPAATGVASGGDCLEQPYAVFARSETENFHLTGARNIIEGDVHTNDLLKMAGNNDVITGDGEAVDGFFVRGKTNQLNEVPAGVEGYPLTIDPDSLGAPTFEFEGDVNLNDRPEVWAAPGQLKPGLYRATGTISLSTNGVKGNVTFVADSIRLPGKNHTLTAFSGGVLGFATGGGNNTIHVAGNGGAYAGLFAAPNGAFQLTGHQNEISGMIMADTFKMSGSNNAIRFADHGYCPAPTPEPTPTPTATPTPTPTPTATPTPTPTPEGTASPVQDSGENASPSPEPTPTGAPAGTPEPTITPPPD